MDWSVRLLSEVAREGRACHQRGDNELRGEAGPGVAEVECLRDLAATQTALGEAKSSLRATTPVRAQVLTAAQPAARTRTGRKRQDQLSDGRGHHAPKESTAARRRQIRRRRDAIRENAPRAPHAHARGQAPVPVPSALCRARRMVRRINESGVEACAQNYHVAAPDAQRRTVYGSIWMYGANLSGPDPAAGPVQASTRRQLAGPIDSRSGSYRMD